MLVRQWRSMPCTHRQLGRLPLRSNNGQRRCAGGPAHASASAVMSWWATNKSKTAFEAMLSRSRRRRSGRPAATVMAAGPVMRLGFWRTSGRVVIVSTCTTAILRMAMARR